MRATIRAEGWYTSATGSRLCRFVTRITAHVGSPLVRVCQRTIITPEALERRLIDIGWSLDVRERPECLLGLDDTAQRTRLGRNDEVFLRQDSATHAVLMDGRGVLAEGNHADGWCTCSGASREAVGILVRDMPQKLPKEISVRAVNGQTRLGVHM